MGLQHEMRLKFSRWMAYFCSGLEKSPFGAKSDFEIWAFKGFLYLDKKISPKKGLEVSTPKNLKWFGEDL